MKPRYLTLFFLLCMEAVLAQVTSCTIDTVYCTDNNTSYLIFKDKVELVDIGSPEDYVSQIEENSIFIRALKTNVPASTMLLKTGKTFYYGIVNYKKDNKRFLYDFSKPSENMEISLPKKGSVEEKTSGIDQALVRNSQTNDSLANKIRGVVKAKNELSSLGFISSFIEAAVTVIRNDNKNTYLKIVLKNKSSIPYKLDFISFQYFQHMKKGFAKKGKENGKDVFPIEIPAIQEIQPFSTRALGYVIPSFGLADKGYLMILFRESSGDRVLKIKVPGQDIQKAFIIGNEK